MSKRKSIGLLLCHMEDDYPSEVCRGAMMAAEEMDANLVILPGRFLDAALQCDMAAPGARERDTQYNTIFAYAREAGLDALVVTTGTICRFLNMERIRAFFAGFGDIPIISLSIRVPGYPCIRIDEGVGLTAAIEHLIIAHGRRKLAFVSGPKGHQEADARLDIFRRTLGKHGLAVDESLICYGNFSRNDPNVERFVEENCHRVDAICFASDEMAFAGIRKLKELGIAVGDGVSVTGYDDNLNVTTFGQGLTTVSTTPSLLGYCGVLACRELSVDTKPMCMEMPSALRLRTSCGCTSVSLSEHDARAASPAEMAERMTDALYGVYRNSPTLRGDAETFRSFAERLFSDAADADVRHVSDTLIQSVIDQYVGQKPNIVIRQRTYVDVLMRTFQLARALAEAPEKRIEVLDMMARIYREITLHDIAMDYYKLDAARENGYRINDIVPVSEAAFADPYRHIVERMSRLPVRAGYLYLFSSPRRNDGDGLPAADTLLLKGCHIGNATRFPAAAEQQIARSELFSNGFMDDARKTMVLTPLYYGDMHYGLLLLDLDYDALYYLYDMTDKVGISLRLANLMRELGERMKQIKSANDLLDMLSKVDELTGIYNRRGFFDAAGTLIADTARFGSRALLLFADLMRLKTINDEFGHDEGDLTIRTAAQALVESLGVGATVGRIGGDEFAALVLPEDGVSADDLIARVDERLRIQSAEMQRGYTVQLSIGAVEFVCSDEFRLKELLMQADMLQYEDKQKRKRRI